MNIRVVALIAIISGLILNTVVVSAQNELAATLEVLSAGVQVQRANTSNLIEVKAEAIVGVGDVIRTDATGRARITFFADGTDATVEPNSEYRIVKFQGDDQAFQLTVQALAGQVMHRLNRALGASSSYEVLTPGMTLAARGTLFTVRVEADGRSAMLTREGSVSASAENTDAEVPADYGVRAEVNAPLSDVVQATTFEELDAALDGCIVAISTVDDVRLNVRLGPSLTQPRVGTVGADEIDAVIGVSESGSWYRIAYRGGFGWILSSSAEIDSGCAGLRVFGDTQAEDGALYLELGDSFTIESLGQPEATQESENNP